MAPQNDQAEAKEEAKGEAKGEAKEVLKGDQIEQLGPLKKYDSIIIDINSPSDKEDMNPPAEFLEKEFLLKLKSLLNPGGMLTINILSHKDQTVDNCIKVLNSTFDIIYSNKLDNELNTILFIINHDFKREQERILVESDRIVNKKEIETNFRALTKLLAIKWDPIMNMDVYTSNILIRCPNINANPFQRTNFHVFTDDEEKKNKTKEMYLEDKEKMNKSQRRKKKNKNR